MVSVMLDQKSLDGWGLGNIGLHGGEVIGGSKRKKKKKRRRSGGGGEIREGRTETQLGWKAGRLNLGARIDSRRKSKDEIRRPVQAFTTSTIFVVMPPGVKMTDYGESTRGTWGDLWAVGS